MTFSEALECVKDGCRISREEWNGKGLHVELQAPNEHSLLDTPYLFLVYPAGSAAYPEGARVPWVAGSTDLLANDWEWARDVIERTVDPYADGPNPSLSGIAEQIEDGMRYVCGDKD